MAPVLVSRVLVSRRHVDLLRVSTMLCPAAPGTDALPEAAPGIPSPGPPASRVLKAGSLPQ